MRVHRLLSAVALCVCISYANALNPESYPAKSVLSSGRWIKVETDTTGIFEIDYDRLKEWGFPEPEKVSVFGYGAIEGTSHAFSTDMPGDLVPAAAIHTSDGRILFYSEGDVRTEIQPADTYVVNYRRNYYGSNAYYFLTDSQVPAPPVESDDKPSDADALKWHAACVLVEDEIQNPGKGGVFFHGCPVSPGDEISIPFPFSGYYTPGPDDGAVPQAVFRLELARKGKAFTLGIDHSDNISVADGNALSQIVESFTTSGGIYSIKDISLTFSRAGNAPETESASFTLKFPEDAGCDYCAIEKAMIIYPQIISAPKKNELIVSAGAVPERTPMTIAGAGAADLAVWNVSDHTCFRSYRVSARPDGSAVCTISGAEHNQYTRLAVFDKSASHRKVRYIGPADNSNLHGLATPDMVIVTTAALADDAGELADIHRRFQGFDVAVVRMQEIFNEFSSGSRTPAAIRRFLKMLYDRNPDRLRYILLYGPSTYNNRGIGMDNIENYIPVFQAERLGQAAYVYSNFASDQYLGMVDDNFNIANFESRGKVRLAVGRIPARTADDARIINEKIRRRFIEPLPARIFLRAVMSGDAGDGGEHLIQANNDVSTLKTLNGMISVARADTPFFYDPSHSYRHDIYGGNTTLDALAQQLRTGTGLFCYCGHGNYKSLGSCEIYDIRAARSLKYKYLPFVCQTTCSSYAFDSHTNNITEEMLFNPDGGAIASVSSCRSVYLSQNKQLSSAIMKAYASASPKTCTGDILVDARRIMMGSYGYISSTLGNNCLAYNLCGDPAIPLGAPGYSIDIAKTDAEPLSPVTIHATVTDSDGNTVPTFSGPVVIDVYDVPLSLTSRGDYISTQESDSGILGTFQAKARNGIIDASFVMPAPSADGSHRIVVTATDSETGDEAAGVLSGVQMKSTDGNYPPGTDTSAPKILALYIDSPSFAQGDMCASSFTLSAVINPSATGLKVSAGDISSASRAFLDGKIIHGFMNRIVPDGEGNIRINCRFADISPGRHVFTLKLRNNAGATATGSLAFFVSDSSPCTLGCDAEEVVRSEPVTFTVASEESDIQSARISITAADGTLVRSAAMTGGSFAWDLRDNDGNPVADGEYRASALYEGRFCRGGSNIITLVVIK